MFVSSFDLFYLTRFHWENHCLQILRNPVALNSYLGPSALSKNFFWFVQNLTREATLCQNILNALRIFTRISNFRCFHETKRTQNEVGRFFYNLAEFVFEYFCNRRRILATFAKFLSQFAFRNKIVPLPKSQPRHPARAQAPLPLPHKFFDVKSFYKIPPLLPIVIAKSR